MTEKFFPRAYNLKSQGEVDQLYDAWATSYDDEVISEGYQTPARLVAALAKFAPKSAKILDIGCGTGFSGLHLHDAGFTDISGSDPNKNMLKHARSRGIYQHLIETDLSDPYPFPIGTYDAITAIGVIGSGAAPATLLEPTVRTLTPNGLLAFSYNDAALALPEFTNALENIINDKLVELIFKEYGPHFSKKDVRSNVYVLRRL
jgi:predicted TPR repeat methyltransferase